MRPRLKSPQKPNALRRLRKASDPARGHFLLAFVAALVAAVVALAAALVAFLAVVVLAAIAAFEHLSIANARRKKYPFGNIRCVLEAKQPKCNRTGTSRICTDAQIRICVVTNAVRVSLKLLKLCFLRLQICLLETAWVTSARPLRWEIQA